MAGSRTTQPLVLLLKNNLPWNNLRASTLLNKFDGRVAKFATDDAFLNVLIKWSGHGQLNHWFFSRKKNLPWNNLRAATLLNKFDARVANRHPCTCGSNICSCEHACHMTKSRPKPRPGNTYVRTSDLDANSSRHVHLNEHQDHILPQKRPKACILQEFLESSET